MTKNSSNHNDRQQRRRHCKTERKEKAREKARKYFAKHFSQASTPVSDDYTKFSKHEILPGNVLGKGAFGIVWEVTAIRLDGPSNGSSGAANNASRPDAAARQFLAQHCAREEFPANKSNTVQPQQYARYAIKALSNQTVNITCDDKLLFQSLIAMVVEAHLLSKMEPHPHIIKMRACSDADPFSEDFFIVMDRLYGTLGDRLKEWQRWERNNAPWTSLLPRQRRQRWGPRFEACRDLASALCHLHHHGIVHRDLKPQNIGYNIRGDLTLFDFGLSRELPSSSKRDAAGLYKMTGFCGSPRYMAPEIANNLRYNEKADVYSYSVLAWQIFTLEKPYTDFRMNDMKRLVWKPPNHVRPELQKLYAHRKIQSLLKQSWSPDIGERPTMREICATLRQESMQQCRDGDARRLRTSAGNGGRRSTFIFRNFRRVQVAPKGA
jgi:serine/threonine protein kinase